MQERSNEELAMLIKANKKEGNTKRTCELYAELIKNMRPSLEKIVSKYKYCVNFDRVKEDLMQECTMLIIKLVDTYDANKKASFEYFFIDIYTAGIVLTGTEIKSIRLGKASLVDTFCYINNGEIWVKGMNISPYFYGSYNNHDSKRDRKLLLNKKEIYKLQSATKQTGFTIVPILVFIDENGRAKMDIALCKGKKEYDKRQTLKEKEDRREMDRAMKNY